MNYSKPSMATFESVYRSEALWVTLISAEYTSGYIEHDFNEYPAISFPVVSCFFYEAGKTKLLLHTNHILFERAQTEFKVSKYPMFSKDVTLCIQFMKLNEELQHSFSKCNRAISVQK